MMEINADVELSLWRKQGGLLTLGDADVFIVMKLRTWNAESKNEERVML